MDALTPEVSQLRNRHGRRFSWRVSEGSAGNAEIAGIIRLSAGDYPDILEDYLRISRSRHTNATALAFLQLHILHDIAVQEKAAKHYKSLLKSSVQNNIETLNSRIFEHRLLMNAMRVIGDGIAWRRFGFDRSIPHVLSANPVKQTILDDGLLAELNAWAAISAHASKRAILNSLTNCIGIGDVTSVDDDGSVEIIEVKSGKAKSSRKIRQKHRLQEAAGFLDTGQGFIDGHAVSIRAVPITPGNTLEAMRQLLEQAGVHGWTEGYLSSHCRVECVDYGSIQDFASIRPLMDQAQKIANERWAGDEVISFHSLDLLAFSPNVAPFSVFPFGERMCVDLSLGKKSFISHINMSELRRFFERAGWKVSPLSAAEMLNMTKGNCALRLEKSGFFCDIPPGDLSKIQFEMLLPQTILDTLEYIRHLDSTTRGGYAIWVLEGEGGQWH